CCGNTYGIVRTWTATDTCGNSSSCNQVIIVRDTTPPVITCPRDKVLECPADTSVAANGSATATDTCNDVTIASNDVRTNGCRNTYGIVRTWTATDTCGNSSSCKQVITVIDSTPPVITCPPDVTIECTDSTNPSNTGAATAEDACSGVASITYT